MPRDMFDAMRVDPGHRTLGELLQERQWAVDEISRLRDEVIRLASRRVDPEQSASSQKISAARDFEDPLISRRLLRLSDVKSLVGLSRSTIYHLISERRFPAQTRVGPRAVRWRATDILAWQDSRAASPNP
jgi:prophage regulatory protein